MRKEQPSDIPTLDVSLRRKYKAGEITAQEVAEELHKAGWYTYVPTEAEALQRINVAVPWNSACKTGTRIPYPAVIAGRRVELVEWKCPTCMHRWFEYSDEPEYPEVCPLCGCSLQYYTKDLPKGKENAAMPIKGNAYRWMYDGEVWIGIFTGKYNAYSYLPIMEIREEVDGRETVGYMTANPEDLEEYIAR